jgi:CheY-like chemotaxis protein
VQKVPADAAFVRRHGHVEHDDYWVVRVADTGVGIAPEILPKIFDPFFSGKATGQGSGLGLAIGYATVQQHAGHITVDSKVGVGTTFSVYLPALAEDLLPQAQAPADLPGATPRGSGLILIVDDEDVVRQTAATILEECGYRVLLACDGAEAIAVLRQQHASIDAVLLDMAMPKMSGRECYTELKRIAPGVRVVLSSGYRNDPRVAELTRQGIDGFLEKPYTMPEMARLMSEVLKRPRS